ncbi:MAG: O-antigen ligase family protein [Elusimicrobiota bacterium]|jgi:O-antigen ligase|nr:O-antigen ligase family protein [Elusimicrobiota bacterium]
MAKKIKPVIATDADAPENLWGKLLSYWLGAAGLLITLAFFVHTRDSAQIKIFLMRAAAAGAAGLLLCGLYCRAAKIFTLDNFRKLLPFAALFIYVLLSYFCLPHFLGRWNNFIYFLCCAAVFAAAAFGCGPRGLQCIISFVIAAAGAAFGYGLLQIINNYLIAGADPLFWTDFFGKRIFSTSSNPNFFADFCLFALVMITARFLQTRDKKLLILLALGLINIFFTESKGAWLALGACAAVFAPLYLGRFGDFYARHKTRAAALALAALLAVGGLSLYYGLKRARSFDFRVYTWRAALEMFAEKPAFGRGAGSFFIEYARFKKPQIFYIENRHDMQTAHAENYYLETLCTLGAAGFALFAWAAFALARGVYKKLRKYDFRAADARQKRRAFLLLAYTMALSSIYIHNFVDISLYLPSTGYFAALFAGAVFNLTCGPSANDAEDSALPPRAPRRVSLLFRVCAFAACAGFAVSAALILKSFAGMTDGLGAARPLMFFLCWLFALATAAGGIFIFAAAVLKSGRVIPCIILCAACALVYFAWGCMKAGHYAAVAGTLAASGDFGGAAIYYGRAIKEDRFNNSLYQSRALMFARRLDMTRANKPSDGDGPEQILNDYERAERDFAAARKLNPQEPLLYYNLGTLELETAQKNGRQELLTAARENFLAALALDPVFENIYFQLANVELARDNPRAARAWLQKYIDGPAGVQEEYLQRHRANAEAAQHLKRIAAISGPLHGPS